MIKIESGVILLQNGNYRYDYWISEGLSDYDGTINISTLHRVEFTVQPGQVPEIGDFIEGNALVKRQGIQVTEGKMRWPIDYGDHTNGWDSNHQPDTDWKK